MRRKRAIAVLGWRELLRQRMRYVLTGFGIVLGVANVFGVLVTNESTNRGIQARESFIGADVRAWASPEETEHPLTAGRLDELRRLPETREVAALFDVVDNITVGDRQVRLGAMDDAGRGSILAGRLNRGRLFETGRAEAVLTPAASRLTGLNIGDEWTIDLSGFDPNNADASGLDLSLLRLAPGAPRHVRLEVTGLVDDPPNPVGDLSVGSFTSLEYFWTLLEPSYVTEVRFVLESGVDANEWAAARRADMPDLVFEAWGIPGEFRRLLDILQGAMSGAAMIALFVGAFLIYLTFSMRVVERTRLYGTLHAVGATSGQVGRSVVREAMLLGAAATVAGIGLGAVAGLGLLRLVSRTVEVATPALYVSPVALTLAVVVGMGATLAGSLAPALRAARLPPVEAIRGDLISRQPRSRAWVWGLVLLVAGVAVSIADRGIRAPNLLSQTATLAVLLGAVLIVPPMIGPVTRAGRAMFRRATRGVRAVAVMHLVRERSRSAYTAGLIMVVLAMMLALASTHGSIARAIDGWVDKRFGADLFAYRFGIPPEAERAVREVPGVAAVTSMTFGQVRMTRPQRATHNLVLVDPEAFFEISGLPWLDGSDAGARRALTEGGAVLMPAARTDQVRLDRGDAITLEGPLGPRDYTIAGVYTAIGGPEVGVITSFAERRAFGAPRERNVLYINFEAGAEAEEVTKAVDDRLAQLTGEADGIQGETSSGYFFITGAEIKAQAGRQVQTYFSLFYAVLFVAVLIGLLGLANTMVTSVMQRYREIGILQAVGATPGDIRRMIVAESVSLVAIAFVLSLALGSLISRLIVDGAGALLGFPIDFVFPIRWIAILGGLAIGVALVAAVAPARRAARLTPVEALRFD